MHSLTLIQVVGSSTVLISILVKILGFPDQIKQNHARKTTAGLSTLLMVLMFISYILWLWYGILKNDWVLIIPNIIGVILTGFICYQAISYK